MLFVFVVWHGQVIEELEKWKEQMQQDLKRSDRALEKGAIFPPSFSQYLEAYHCFQSSVAKVWQKESYIADRACARAHTRRQYLD